MDTPNDHRLRVLADGPGRLQVSIRPWVMTQAVVYWAWYRLVVAIGFAAVGGLCLYGGAIRWAWTLVLLGTAKAWYVYLCLPADDGEPGPEVIVTLDGRQASLTERWSDGDERVTTLPLSRWSTMQTTGYDQQGRPSGTLPQITLKSPDHEALRVGVDLGPRELAWLDGRIRQHLRHEGLMK